MSWAARWEAFNDGAARWLWRYGTPLIALPLLVLTLLDVVPAYRARFGGGTPGVFTATERDCHRACTSSGTWVSDDGTRRRDDVVLGTGAGSPHPGESVRAVDSGDRVVVYPAGGGWDFAIVTMFLLGSAGVLAAWTYDLRRRRRTRRLPD
jgi:hypothetical protein